MGLSGSVGRGCADASLQADLIFLGGFTNDIILIIKALRGVGVTAPIFGAGPAGNDSVGKGLGEAGDKFFAPMMWNWDLNVPGNKEFVAAYKAANPSSPIRPPTSSSAPATRRNDPAARPWKRRARATRKKLRDVLATTEFTNLPFPAGKIKFGRQRP